MTNSGIGFIGGGMMAEALIKGFLKSNLFSPPEIFVSEPNSDRRLYLEEFYLVATTSNNLEVLENKQLIILAVKPQIMGEVLKEIRDVLTEKHLLITIAAGLPLRFYEKLLPPKTRIVRVMPNTCALVGKSVSVMTKGAFAQEEDVAVAEKIFSCVGLTLRADENYMDAVTALSGSGPAYVALFIEALTDAGVLIGLPRLMAQTLAIETIKGTVELMMVTKKSPEEIKGLVTSPGGTTISAIQVLFEKGFPGIIMDAIKEAYLRSLELKKLVE